MSGAFLVDAMSAFSPLRFTAYAKDLEAAILDLSQEATMPSHAWPVRYRQDQQKQPPMSDPAPTPLPEAEFEETHPEPPQAKPAQQSVTVSEPSRSITGAGFLGSQISDLINAIKGEVNSAFQEIQDSAVELRSGITAAKGVSKALKDEAAQIKSQLGQFSNLPPEDEK